MRQISTRRIRYGRICILRVKFWDLHKHLGYVYGLSFRVIWYNGSMDSRKNKHNFNIKFEKNDPSISLDTYTKTLAAINTMVKEVNYQTNSVDGGVAVRIIAEKPGSFDVVFELVKLAMENGEMVFNGTETLATVISIVVGIIEIKKYLGNRDASDEQNIDIDGDQVNIKNEQGEVVFTTTRQTFNIFLNNQTVNDAVSAQFQAISNDEEIEAITYKNGNDTITITKDHFETLSKKRHIKVNDSKTSTVAATLVISKLVLDNKNQKWQFINQGVKINAAIDDDEFWDKVLEGKEAFANGDRLICDLETIRDYSKALGAYVDKEYIVKNVRDHQRREVYEQLEL